MINSMIHNKFIYSLYLLYCYFCVVSVAAADDLSQIEQKLRLNPPAMGNASDEVAILSKIPNKTLDTAIDDQFKSSKKNTGLKSEMQESSHYLALDKDGVQVYIFKRNHSDFATFRAITHIDASMESLLAVMLDIKSNSKWVDACEKSFLIKKISFNEQYHYQTFYVPFPFKNRDFILHSTMQHDPLEKSITFTMIADSNYCLEKQSELCQKVNQSDLVRVKKSIGTFKLQEKNQGTKITWVQHTNPAGNLPGWLVNRLVKNTAYRSFKNLAEIVTQQQYQNAKLIYDVNGMAVALFMENYKSLRLIEKPVKKEQNVDIFETL